MNGDTWNVEDGRLVLVEGDREHRAFIPPVPAFERERVEKAGQRAFDEQATRKPGEEFIDSRYYDPPPAPPPGPEPGEIRRAIAAEETARDHDEALEEWAEKVSRLPPSSYL